MNADHIFTFALIGNPNAGKSSIFNQLTGLRQKVGNFPGVTVDKKIGTLTLDNGQEVQLVDLPGTYSLYPNSQDERIVLNILTNPSDENYPDAIIYMADLTNLERHLLLFTQLRDLQIPLILCIGMMDVAAETGIFLDQKALEQAFNVPVIAVNGRTGNGVSELKAAMQRLKSAPTPPQYKLFFQPTDGELRTNEQIRLRMPEVNNTYRAILLAHHAQQLPFLTGFQKAMVRQVNESTKFEDLRLQIVETLQRFDRLQPILRQVVQKKNQTAQASLTDRIDSIVTHHIAGPTLFFGLLFLIFQSIFTFSEIPKGWIEDGFVSLNTALKNALPDQWFTSLLTDGVLAGLSSVLVFIPQIAILFFLISLLEEVGYMARTVYLFDRIMQKVGLNGRSIVALVSGGACAIPAIMSTRTISNWKERLITILVTPLISCSARIPVYALLVGFVVPNEHWLGFNKQGWVFMGLYALSVVTALGAAFVFKKILKTNDTTFLAIELPEYRLPHWKNVGLTVWEKVKTFTLEAGKVILLVSVILWFLASFSPIRGAFDAIDTEGGKIAAEKGWTDDQKADYIAGKKLEASFAGHFGKAIEPVIRPLGFDWKIGIALLSSFAAREAFVSTMATIYSIGSAKEDGTERIQDRLKAEVRPNGQPMYDTRTALSLLIFYVFAMQCMSTMAIVKRETKSWKWVIIQFLFMGFLAYFGSLLAYHIF